MARGPGGDGRRRHQRRARPGGSRRSVSRSETRGATASSPGRRHRHHGGPARPTCRGRPHLRRFGSIALQSVIVGIDLSLGGDGLSRRVRVPAGRGRRRCSRKRSTSRSSSMRSGHSGAACRRRPYGSAGLDGDKCPAHRLASCARGRPSPTSGRPPIDWTSCHPPTHVGSHCGPRDSFLDLEGLLPHEGIEEDRAVHPALAAALGSDETTAALHGTHNEIFRLARLFGHLVRGPVRQTAPHPTTGRTLRRVLYGLDAILRLQHGAGRRALRCRSATARLPSRTTGLRRGARPALTRTAADARGHRAHQSAEALHCAAPTGRESG